MEKILFHISSPPPKASRYSCPLKFRTTSTSNWFFYLYFILFLVVSKPPKHKWQSVNFNDTLDIEERGENRILQLFWGTNDFSKTP